MFVLVSQFLYTDCSFANIFYYGDTLRLVLNDYQCLCFIFIDFHWWLVLIVQLIFCIVGFVFKVCKQILMF